MRGILLGALLLGSPAFSAEKLSGEQVQMVMQQMEPVFISLTICVSGKCSAAYECGMPPVGSAHEQFSIKFYIIAMLFIVFDIEVVFMYPWAVMFKRLGLFGFMEMGVFILILLVGYAYVWKKGALEWE